MFFSHKKAQVSLQVTVIAAEEEEILYKVVVEAKVEKTIFKVEATVKAKGIFKAEEIVKVEDIFTQEEIVKAQVIFKATVKPEDKLHT